MIYWHIPTCEILSSNIELVCWYKVVTWLTYRGEYLSRVSILGVLTVSNCSEWKVKIDLNCLVNCSICILDAIFMVILTFILFVLTSLIYHCMRVGLTLVAIACSSPLEEGIVEQVEYLVEKRGAHTTICDLKGNSPVSTFFINIFI